MPPVHLSIAVGIGLAQVLFGILLLRGAVPPGGGRDGPAHRSWVKKQRMIWGREFLLGGLPLLVTALVALWLRPSMASALFWLALAFSLPWLFTIVRQLFPNR